MKFGVGIGVALGLALVLAPAGRAADKAAIQAAVDRGVAYLKRTQGQDGTWTYSEVGATALCGLALLEGGVKPDDPAVQKAAKAVRQQSITLNKTYSLSLSIMFLDRLGDPADDELIESMAVRLLAGQEPTLGGWSYECPTLPNAEGRRLQEALQQRPEPAARREAPEERERRPTARDLPREIQLQLQLLNNLPGLPPGTVPDTGDNSNTQFAVLALWIARRKGIPVENALRRLDVRFRSTQGPDGSWFYSGTPQAAGPAARPGSPAPSRMNPYSVASMTCAGLLGLALSHGTAMEVTLRAGAGAGGARKPAQDPGKDPVIRAGLLALGRWLGRVLDLMGQPPNAQEQGYNSATHGDAYYFLFSLERVAVAYGLETIGDKDWHQLGADALLARQNQDGSWTGRYPEAGADTCFAILFLQRANLAKDLSATLKGQVKDPARRELRAVDVGSVGSSGGAPKETRPAPAAADPEVSRLSDDLVHADAGRQDTVLRKLRDGKGAVYTDALAHAIHRLDGEVKGQARDALADRLARMKAATLADKLQDDDAEVRRAAALACAMKDERTNVPRLIELLGDQEPIVARSAHAALKSLAGQDLGPDAAGWKEWWSKNGGK
jgi:hypothetical protein